MPRKQKQPKSTEEESTIKHEHFEAEAEPINENIMVEDKRLDIITQMQEQDRKISEKMVELKELRDVFKELKKKLYKLSK